MNQLDFTFDAAPWEQVIAEITPGGELDAIQFLALMEPEAL